MRAIRPIFSRTVKAEISATNSGMVPGMSTPASAAVASFSPCDASST